MANPTNSIKSKGVNERAVFTLDEVGDTNEHDLPDTDGDDSGGGEPFDARGQDRIGIKVVNYEDAALTGDLPASTFDDREMNEDDAVKSDITVNSGGDQSIVVDSDIVMSYWRFRFSFDSAPTGDQTPSVKVVFTTDIDG